MPTFDVVCEPDMVELKNAIEQSNKEITNRFDFKGSDSRVEQKDEALILFGDDDFKLGQVRDVLINKMAKRNVDVRYLKDEKTETIGSDKRKQTMKIQKGITSDLAKKVVRIIKDSKLKVQASIHGDILNTYLDSDSWATKLRWSRGVGRPILRQPAVHQKPKH
jgi:uncharacterized protein YajQ (UPF0234 family)